MRVPRSVAYTPHLTPTEKTAWTLIADAVDAAEHATGHKWAAVSIADTAKKLGVSRSTAKKAIDQLVKEGLVERQRSMIAGYADTYSVPSDEVLDIEVARLERDGRTKY